MSETTKPEPLKLNREELQTWLNYYDKFLERGYSLDVLVREADALIVAMRARGFYPESGK